MSSSRPLLEVDRLSVAWEGTPVLRSISFAVAPGEFFVLLGPNGSGKTTLLRCLAGLSPASAGSVRFGGEEIVRRPPHTRGIGLMFQESALFPHRSVYENIAYAPLLQRRPRPEVEREVDRVVDLLRLTGFEDRRPDQLSGGERQRVALARTLAARPRLVLLDEPFASIDAELKADLHAEFRRALSATDVAAIHVTHDREEGLFLADRVGLLFDGTLEASGPPREVYERPGTVRAARFLGYNVLPGAAGPEAVHPADLRWSTGGAAGVPASVVAAGSTGRGRLVVLRTDDGARVELREATVSGLAPGTKVALAWDRSVPLAP
ncbi:MAG: ABC transporter ATP-binding protein [Thermoplasmata archaeon]